MYKEKNGDLYWRAYFHSCPIYINDRNIKGLSTKHYMCIVCVRLCISRHWFRLCIRNAYVCVRTYNHIPAYWSCACLSWQQIRRNASYIQQNKNRFLLHAKTIKPWSQTETMQKNKNNKKKTSSCTYDQKVKVFAAAQLNAYTTLSAHRRAKNATHSLIQIY